MKNFSPYQFAFFRIILGIYLIIHFGMLIPYAAEVWSNTGLIPDASLNLTYGIFPNILNHFDSPSFVHLFMIIMVVLAVLLLLGYQRMVVSLLLWYGWLCLFNRNNLISNPGIPFVGWLLLVLVVVPKGEPLSLFSENKEKWKMPLVLFYGAWVIMAVGYTISGIDKLNSPSWRDGTAIRHLLENPLARDWSLREFFLTMPAILPFMSWGILALEILFLPLVLFKKSRPIAWLFMVVMHFGILMIVDFADLTFGMLMIHFFTFDPAWFSAVEANKKRIVFFDGVCGLCNSFIDFLMKEDRNNVLNYAPLQGETAKEMNIQHSAELSTIKYYSDGKLFEKSDAVLQILSDLGGFWRCGLFFKILPRAFRDYIYSIVAAKRYKWFGKKESCRMPTPEEREKLLV